MNDKNQDPYLWMEAPEGAKPLEWVQKQNSRTLAKYEETDDWKRAYEVYLEINQRDDKLRIAGLTCHKDAVYQLWTSEENSRGVLQSISPEDFLSANHKAWKDLLDLDELGKREGESWVYQYMVRCDENPRLALLALSRGGKDEAVFREFDLDRGEFVEDGFVIPEGLRYVVFVDEDTLLLSHDTPGARRSSAGFPIAIRLWQRGEALDDAPIVFEGQDEDLWVSCRSLGERGNKHVLLRRHLDFYRALPFHLDLSTRVVTELPIPQGVEVADITHGNLILHCRDQIDTASGLVREGAAIAFPLMEFLETGKISLIPVFAPTDREHLVYLVVQTDRIVLFLLDNVSTKVRVYPVSDEGIGDYQPLSIPENCNAVPISADLDSSFLPILIKSFVQPSRLYSLCESGVYQLIEEEPTKWDSKSYEVDQYSASSKDGTKIPYFVVHHKDWKHDGENPTWLNGYGGFEIPMLPYYNEPVGRTWMDQGGVFVMANIRGGSEFGPAWHKSALLENRQRCYDDFIAVAEDLISRGVTSPRRLGIQGGSNGGLLVGAVLTQRPDLFGAVVCLVPLLDMMRYTVMPNAKGNLPGKFWIAEYGDPIEDAKMAEVIRRYSPYQNLDSQENYPCILVMTSTKDDRVVPGHARKFAARLQGFGQEVWYFESPEGGHGGGADYKQMARLNAITYAYLREQLAADKD